MKQQGQDLATANKQKSVLLTELNAVLDAIDFGVMFMGPDLRGKIINRAFRNMWGIPDEFVETRPTIADVINYNRYNHIYDVSESEFDAYVAARVEEIHKGDFPPYERHLADGRIIRYQGIALPDGGCMLNYFDITELKRLELEAKKAEVAITAAHARLNHILAFSPTVVYSFEATGNYNATFVSENIKDLLGYEPGEYLGDRNFWEERLHPDDAPNVASGWMGHLLKEGHHINEYRFRHKDGSYHWVHDELRVIYDDANKPVEIVGSWSDITARKEAEAEVDAGHARLNHILASSPSVLYSFEAKGDNNPTFVSENVREVFGYEPSEYLEDRNFVLNRIHPDDAARIGGDLSRLFEKGHLINEYRFRHKDGSYRWVHDELRVIYDDVGNPVEVVGSWSDISAQMEINEEIVSLLSSTSLFGSLDESVLRDIAAEANPVQLMGGETLIRQGDSAESFYLVTSGRVRAFVTEGNGNEQIVGEIGKGELVGEMSVLTGEPRPASARAIRDTVLLQISKDTLYRHVERHPKVLLLISKVIADRYQRKFYGTGKDSVISTIAIIPAGHGVHISDFARRLATSLSQIGSTLHLDVKSMEHELGQGSAQKPDKDKLLRWLNDQESRHQYVIYESTLEPSSWTQQCIRHADRILLVGVTGNSPELNSIEKEIASQQNNQVIARQELVLLHPNRDKLPSGTGKWLDLRGLDDHHHIVFDSTDDYKRLCRFLTGHAISLVLGGGGARGCAHIGLIRALQELHVPIDAIGGTSIGSIVASAFALGCNSDEILDKIDNIARESNPIKDLTLPIVSLMTGGKLNKSLQKMYGDVQIEDLWVKYYSVSANLTRAQTEVHERGPVWKSVRASMSIPGQIPPVVFNGELHVDGGVLNNLPVDVMRNRCDGIIIANNVSPSIDLNAAGLSEATHSGWYYGWGYILNALNPLSKKVGLPNILNTLMRSGMLSSIEAINVSKAMADIYMCPPIEKFQLLDFGSAHEIEEVGYKYAMDTMNKQLQDNELLKSALLI